MEKAELEGQFGAAVHESKGQVQHVRHPGGRKGKAPDTQMPTHDLKCSDLSRRFGVLVLLLCLRTVSCDLNQITAPSPNYDCTKTCTKLALTPGLRNPGGTATRLLCPSDSAVEEKPRWNSWSSDRRSDWETAAGKRPHAAPHLSVRI